MSIDSDSSFERFMGKLNHMWEMCKNIDPKKASFGDFSYWDKNFRVIYFNESTFLKVGKFCSIGTDVTIVLGGEHRTDWITTFPFNTLFPDFAYIEGHPATKGDIKIGNDVWIAAKAVILSGVTIGDGCVIGTNALVTKDMPPYSIWGGNPAKLIKYRFSQEIIDRLVTIKWWDWPYRDIHNVIPILQSNNFPALFQYYEENILRK